MADEIVLGNVMVDCDDEKGLQKFYNELLGWEICELYDRQTGGAQFFRYCISVYGRA